MKVCDRVGKRSRTYPILRGQRPIFMLRAPNCLDRSHLEVLMPTPLHRICNMPRPKMDSAPAPFPIYHLKPGTYRSWSIFTSPFSSRGGVLNPQPETRANPTQPQPERFERIEKKARTDRLDGNGGEAGDASHRQISYPRQTLGVLSSLSSPGASLRVISEKPNKGKGVLRGRRGG